VYDLDGRLVAVPFRRGVKGNGGMPAAFDLDAHGLERLGVAERNGVVFASFAPERVPPLEEYLGPTMLHYFDRVFDGRALTLLGYQRQRVPGNWKLMFENIKDPYHASLLHVFLVTFGLFRADQPSSVRMDDSGRHAVLCSQRGEQRAGEATADMRAFHEDLHLADPRLLDPVKEFAGPETVVMQTLWPNLIVQQQSNTLATRQLVTRGPSAFDLHWTFFGYADDDEAMTTRRLRQANLMGPSGFVSIDDGEVMELSHEGITPFPDAAGVLEMGGVGTGDESHMVTEAAIRAFYSYYREVMEL
jgi:salicylate 5-hydroxylase large subunit